MRAPCFFLIALLLSQSQASAIILYGLDNSATTSDPGSGAPWNSVAKMTNADGTQVAPSAVYLGNGYMLTANHVGLRSHVTFDGITTYAIDGSFTPVNPSAGVDMKIFKLASLPPVAAVNLLTTSTEAIGSSAVIVGWGVGRNPSVALESNSVTWGDATTATKRWGINVPRESATISYDGYNYDALVTYLGQTSGSPAGVGIQEGAATLNDSGSALFQNIGGTWYMIGLTTSVETGGTSTFGDDSTVDPNGDANYFARISTYQSQIAAAIPEPSALLLFTSGALLLLFRRRK